MPVVVVVGGGFAGLEAAKRLARVPVEVLLLDRRNHHLFQPLLYQVATAALSPADIASPIRRILRAQRNARVLLADVERVDLARRVVVADGVEHAWDYLVLAAGATHSYFGHDAWAAHAPGLKTIDDAIEIRRRVLVAFEEAEMEGDAGARRAKLTFVVVGGGPTGVELAGALKEIAARSIPRDFRTIDTTTTRVVLVEGADRLLAAMPPSLSARALRDLEALGVEVRLRSYVTAVDAGGVVVAGERIEAGNVLWAAGVEASPLARTLGVPLDDRGRVLVEPDLSIPRHPHAFVVGDLAHVADRRTGRPVPGMAPAARQMGRHAARRIRDLVAGRAGSEPFAYRDPGQLATIGRARAVAEIRGLRFSGFLAWLLWGAVHIYFLIGFRMRLFVVLSWIWSYVVFAKGARLITGDGKARSGRPTLR